MWLLSCRLIILIGWPVLKPSKSVSICVRVRDQSPDWSARIKQHEGSRSGRIRQTNRVGLAITPWIAWPYPWSNIRDHPASSYLHAIIGGSGGRMNVSELIRKKNRKVTWDMSSTHHRLYLIFFLVTSATSVTSVYATIKWSIRYYKQTVSENLLIQ